MILESIFNLIFALIKAIFNLLPSLPNLQESDLVRITQFFDNIVFGNLQLIDLFIRPSTIKTLVPLMLIIINFEHIWELFMFVWRKLPISSE